MSKPKKKTEATEVVEKVVKKKTKAELKVEMLRSGDRSKWRELNGRS